MSHQPAPYALTTAPSGQPYALLHKEPEALWDEDALQQEAFHWMRHHHPHEEQSLLAIPNGGFRSKATASKLLATGVKRGYPDTALELARNGYYGLRIELKKLGGTCEWKGQTITKKPGTVSKEQKEWHALLTENGFCVVVAWGLQGFIDAITEYLG